MTATFGDLIGAADAHYAGVSAMLAEAGPAVTSQTVTAAARGIGQVAAILSSYTVVADSAGVSSPAWVTASARAHLDLSQAVACLPPGTPASQGASVGTVSAARVAGGLADVAIALAAGHDLLAGRITSVPAADLAYGNWADSLTAATAAVALAPDVAGWCTRLAHTSAQLSHASASVAGEVRYGLRAAHDHFSSAAATLNTMAEQPAASDAFRALVYAIPTTDPPRRQPADGPEPISVLCERITTSAERIRAICAAMAGDPGRPAHISMAGWRWAARAAAVAADSSELILTTLTRHAARLGLPNGAHIPAGATTVMNVARAKWLVASRSARSLTTTHQPAQTSPLAGDLSDLLLRLGRIAHANETWTPARADQAAPRGPADLARDAKELGAVISAVHHSLDALVCAAAAGASVLQAAATSKALWVSSRPWPRDDWPYRFVPAPAFQADMLVTAFRNAGETSAQACAMLDTLAVALRAPSRTLAAAHSAGHRWHAPSDGSPTASPQTDVALRKVPPWQLAFPHQPNGGRDVLSASPGAGVGPVPVSSHNRGAFLVRRLRPR